MDRHDASGGLLCAREKGVEAMTGCGELYCVEHWNWIGAYLFLKIAMLAAALWSGDPGPVDGGTWG